MARRTALTLATALGLLEASCDAEKPHVWLEIRDEIRDPETGASGATAFVIGTAPGVGERIEIEGTKCWTGKGTRFPCSVMIVADVAGTYDVWVEARGPSKGASAVGDLLARGHRTLELVTERTTTATVTLGRACEIEIDDDRASLDAKCRANSSIEHATCIDGVCAYRGFCGNRIVENGERCDDGNTNPNDACDTSCRDVTWTATIAVGGAGASDPSTFDITSPRDVIADPEGNLYVSVPSARRVFRIDRATGRVSVVAGRGTPGHGGDDGEATAAELTDPRGLAFDRHGNLYICDSDEDASRVRKVDTRGVISTFVSGLPGAIGIAIDKDGNAYVADWRWNQVVRVDAESRAISVVAGQKDKEGFSGDNGPATAAKLGAPNDVALGPDGAIYIADRANHRIRKVADGTISTVAGDGGASANLGDGGPATSAHLDRPRSVAVDADGQIYIADSGNRRIRRVGTDKTIATVAGSGEWGDDPEEATITATLAGLSRINAVSIDRDGRSVLIADAHFVRRLRFDTSVARIERVAGIGPTQARDRFPATAMPLGTPYGLAFSPSNGALHFTDGAFHKVYRLSGDRVERIAGTGAGDRWRDGHPAKFEVFAYPTGVAVDAGENVFVTADDKPGRLARIDATTGEIWSFDRNFADLEITQPRGMVRDDRSGDLIVAGAYEQPQVVRVDTSSVSSGTATRIAGKPSKRDCDLASVAPLEAGLYGAQDVAVEPSGAILVAVTAHHRVLRIANGSVSLVYGREDCEPPQRIGELRKPMGVDVDRDGNIYIADTDRHRIVKVRPDGSNFEIVAGTTDVPGLSGERLDATRALLRGPTNVAIAPDGAIVIADSGNARIRRIDPTTNEILTIVGSVNPPDMAPFAESALETPTSLAWIDGLDGLLVAGGSGGRVFFANLATRQATVVAGEPGGYAPGTDPVAAPRVRAKLANVLRDASGIAYDEKDGVVFLAEREANSIRKLRIVRDAASWTLEEWSGTGARGHKDAVPTSIEWNRPSGLAFDPDRRVLYVADTGNHVVRAIFVDTATALSQTILGVPGEDAFFGGDDVETTRLSSPLALRVARDGSLFIADTKNHRVLVLDRAWTKVTTILGDGSASSAGVGEPSKDFPVHEPAGLAFDRYGNLYVTSHEAVRLVTPSPSGELPDGEGSVFTIYGKAPRKAFPESVTRCLSGIHVTEDSQVYVLDACQGFMLELERATK